MTWFTLKCHGARQIPAAIYDNIAVAHRLAEAVDASDDFERLAPAPLSIVCFRYAPAALLGRRDALNALNRELTVEVQRDGAAYLSNAMIGENFALRACVVNYRTTAADVEELLATIRRVAARMS